MSDNVFLNFKETFIYKDADKYGYRRKYIYREVKKISSDTLRKETTVARLVGATDAAERILQAIVQNPTWDRTQIEAELTIFIQGANNVVAETLEEVQLIDMLGVLERHGYMSKKEE